MIAASRHRGPDGSGSAEISLPSGTLFLGHTRLSILDLSENSSQPMKDASSGSWLVFNGEIYNFRELRRELEQQGEHFLTTGDSEVLLKALVRWGEGALRRLQGMFAFAFWDVRQRQLLLARDPLGIKPLYYHATKGCFAFASEVKGLAAGDLRTLTLDRAAVQSFLAFGAVVGPRTVYNEIRELEPGHLLRVEADFGVQDSEFWSLSQGVGTRPAGPATFETALSQIRERLEHAVTSHLVSDVPVGVFLSGGVDSSLLALLASKHADSPITLLTVAFPEQEFSELPYAQEIAARLPHHHEVVLLSSEQLLNLLPEAIGAMDQPTVDGVNTFVISRVAAARGLKVLLNGLGGDELFGGYTTFYKVPFLRRYGWFLGGVARMMPAFWFANPQQWEKVSHAGGVEDITAAYLLQRCIRWEGSSAQAISPQLRQSVEALSSDFQRVAALELQFYMRNQLLRDADVFSMANSVELRVPLLDLELLNSALGIPAGFHFEGKRGKRLTRRILSDLAGADIPARRKMGFTFPWRKWLATTLKSAISSVLLNRDLYEALFIDPAYGKQLLDGLESGDRTQSWSEVWSLFMLLNWQLRNGVECAVA